MERNTSDEISIRAIPPAMTMPSITSIVHYSFIGDLATLGKITG
jgi:hypothetical protein